MKAKSSGGKRTTPKYDRLAKAVQYLSPILLSHRKVPRAPGRNAVHEKILSQGEKWVLGGNLIGLAVGVKYTNGIPDLKARPCLKFYVRRKLAKRRLRKAEAIPELITLEDHGAAFVTDVDSLYELPTAQLDKRFRPVLPGTALGSFRGTRGTIGLLVRRVVNGIAGPKLLLT